MYIITKLNNWNKVSHNSKLFLLYNTQMLRWIQIKQSIYRYYVYNANYAEIIKSIKFSLSTIDDFIPESPETRNYFYNEQTEISDRFLQETEQQNPVFRQFILCKKYKNRQLFL